MNDPIAFFYKREGFDKEKIAKITTGGKYTAVMLKNGQIGVCANLKKRIEIDMSTLVEPDLHAEVTRIILCAYYNALLNYHEKVLGEGDLFKRIDFGSYKRISMVGLIKPIADQFKNRGISLSIFDRSKDLPFLSPMEKQEEILQNSDLLILTSTSIFNESFSHLIEMTGDKCPIILLGPSTPMDPTILDYKNVIAAFGAQFELNDNDVLKIIGEGMGTRTFLKRGHKSYISL